MIDTHDARPPLGRELTGADLQRWYWLKTELTDFARDLGVGTTGSKADLTARIVAVLDGRPVPPTFRPAPSAGTALSGVLTDSTIIPPGQRCSQQLRSFLAARLGSGFHFDRHMRAFIKTADGTTTLGDALEHWRATRAEPAASIDPQFELNRFTRAWHRAHPSGARSALLADWARYRSLPIEERGRI